MATRVLVTGEYIDPSTYLLFHEDGSRFMRIKEGEFFKIDDEIQFWYPTRVKKKDGKGTMLICRKFGDAGNIIEEIPLIHNKRGLWPIDFSVTRNEVSHNYHGPQSKIEKKLASMGISTKIIKKVDDIDVVLELGGGRFGKLSDGKSEDLTEPQCTFNNILIMRNHSTYQSHIYDATYIIYYDKGIHKIKKVIITPNVDENRVIELLSDIKKFL